MSEVPVEPLESVLAPMERISEVLFGTIMALTFTCTLGIATADNIKIETMLIGALGCNLAWGIIDAGVFLLTNVRAGSVAQTGADLTEVLSHRPPWGESVSPNDIKTPASR